MRIATPTLLAGALILTVGCRETQTRCNGSFEWCDRPFNEVAQICTHNAMSSSEENFVLPTPNHVHGIQRQLDDGVRCLMLDTYWFEDAPYLCHGVCGPWGASPLDETLTVLSDWLANHPTDVVTIIFQSNLSEAQLSASLVDAQLQAPTQRQDPAYPLYEHTVQRGSTWPTLHQLIMDNQRLVLLTDDPAANGRWQVYWPEVAWETPYADPTFPCHPGRGDPTASANQLVILNHYSLCDLGGCESESALNNTFTSITTHAQRCVDDATNNPRGQLPTFINVDHYHVPAANSTPDVMLAMQEINTWWRP